MSVLDWIVLLASLVFIAVYGIYKSRGSKNIESYLKGDNEMPWYSVGFSIMATQASAITFLSAPGQAYMDGMRFVQFYFGLPIAMVIISTVFLPIYYKLKVYTAYEFLENRFDLKTRALAAFLFLIQRGLAAGLTIYAPSIILSSILGWNIYLTNLFIGGIVVIYTVTGGSKAVSYTQMGQMAIILFGMLVAGIMVVKLLPPDVSFSEATHIAGKLGKLNIIDFKFDIHNQYNIWSGLIGGLFLSLSYFGTDQSQVARYLSGKSISQSRMGLLMNGLVKIPMQFSILFIGALLFVFFIFNSPPIFFNKVEVEKIKTSAYAQEFNSLENRYTELNQQKKNIAIKVSEENISQLKQIDVEQKGLKKQATQLMEKNDSKANTNDTNYVFLYFVMNYLPAGLIGLLIAVIFAASMSSTSSELNALASTTIIDIYKRSIKTNGSETHYLNGSKWATVLWGVYAIMVAMFATKMGSLIEAVNKLGSYFYGTILGIFLVAFFVKQVKGSAAFYAALISEAIVIYCAVNTQISFLWYNLIGAIMVILFALLIYAIQKSKTISQ